MKSIDEIELKIRVFKGELNQNLKKQVNYKWSELELDEGSTRFGSLQEKEVLISNKIQLLEWVIE